MRTEIVFQPAGNPRWGCQLKPQRGYATAWGLVFHPAINKHARKAGYWNVSDPETGCLAAYGEYPGIEGAVAGLVSVVMHFAQYPGGFAAAVAKRRQMRAGANK